MSNLDLYTPFIFLPFNLLVNRVPGSSNIASNNSNNNDSKSTFGPNLSKEELLGIKSLKMRVKDGSIVIYQMDKSKCFIYNYYRSTHCLWGSSHVYS